MASLTSFYTLFLVILSPDLQIVDGEVYFLGEMEGFMEFHRMAKVCTQKFAIIHSFLANEYPSDRSAQQ